MHSLLRCFVFSVLSLCAGLSTASAVTVTDFATVPPGVNGNMAFDADGNLYVASMDAILKITPSGVVSTLTTNVGMAQQLAFHDGKLFAAHVSGVLYEVGLDGAHTTRYTLPDEVGTESFSGLAIDAAGNFYLTSYHNNIVYVVPPDWSGKSTLATVTTPQNAAFRAGSVYVASSSEVVAITTAGSKTVYADGFGGVIGLLFDAAGNLYVSDFMSHEVKKVAASDQAVTVVLEMEVPRGLAMDSAGNLYVADMDGVIKKVSFVPEVTGVSPSTGPTAGGTTVTLTGSGFTGATAVMFGAAPATSFTIHSDTQITAVAPAGNGSVNVTVTTPAGTSATSSSNAFLQGRLLTINDVSQAEGDSGTTMFTFTVNLSEPAGAVGVMFDIATADGTATAGSDYTAKALTGQYISMGSSSYTFSVLVNGDIDMEAAETFFVNLTNVTGALVGDGQGQGTITNDDTIDLAVTISDAPDPAVRGGNVTYTVTVANNGSLPPTAAALSIPLPAGTTFVSLSTPGVWSATTPAVGANGTIHATNDAVAAGASESFTLVVDIETSVAIGTTFSTTATVSTSDTETSSANNSATATTTVTAGADLALSAGVGSEGLGSFDITITNSGPDAATGVAVYVQLSGAANYASATASGWTISPTGNNIFFTDGTIAAGDSKTLTIETTPRVGAGRGAGVKLWAVALAETPDSDPSDNEVTLHSIVGPALNPAAAEPLASVAAGARVTENLYPAGDVDIYSFDAQAGDRVFIATTTTASSDAPGSSRDTLIRVVGPDGVTVLEVDDDDGVLSSTSSSIAGLALPTDGTYYVVVECQRPEAIVFPYELFLRLQRGSPTAKTAATASYTGQELTGASWVLGSIGVESDSYTITLGAGETLFVSLDLDPARLGSELDCALVLSDINPEHPLSGWRANGSDLVSDTPPSSEAMVFTAKETTTYKLSIHSTSGTGNYQLSVSVLPARSENQATTYAATVADGGVPDGEELVSTLTVPSSHRIGKLKVALHVTSNSWSNLHIHLTSPGGNTVGLVREVSGYFLSTLDVVLDDDGAYAIAFDPENPVFPPEMADIDGAILKPVRDSRLSWFNGQDAQGTWTLTIRDRDANGGTATLHSWSLIVVDEDAAPTGVVANHFSADFEADDGGFTHSGTADEWEHGTPAAAPIVGAHSGTKAWKTDLDGTFEASSNQDLVSPNIDLTAVPTGRVVELAWVMSYQLADASTMAAYVAVEEVGGDNATQIAWRWLGPDMRDEEVGADSITIDEAAGWGLHRVLISDFAGKTIRLRFHLESSGATPLAGLAIDDVSVRSYRALSTDASLSALALSAGTLSPSFASGTASYTANVANAVSSVTLTPTATDPQTIITVNASVVTSGSPSGAISLAVGANVISVVSTAEDGVATQTYTVTITRLPNSNADLSNLVLSSGTLTPGFASGTTSYAADVSNAVTSITVTPTLAESTATVKVNDVAVASGNTSGAINLSVGANTLAVVTTAQDGTTKTYTIVVTRAASSNADLSALTLSVGTLSPTFVSGMTNYSASVTNATASITVTPTVADATATVKINDISVSSGAASGSISLNVGANTVQVVVTAQNSATKTYTLTVTRAPAINSALAGLVLSEGVLSPAFVSGTTIYAADVSYATSVLTVTATTADTAATILINGQAATSGSPSAPLDLNPGSNPVEIVVTAQDGVTTTSYTVTVTRALGYHSADTDGNWRLSLLELTRVIELYNTRDGTTRTGAYYTDATTEDGFAAGTGTITSHHSADTNQDGRLSLLELTRVIELYNTRDGTTRTGEYHRTELETEDGFAPGARTRR